MDDEKTIKLVKELREWVDKETKCRHEIQRITKLLFPDGVEDKEVQKINKLMKGG